MPLFSRLGPYPRETLDQLAVHQDGRGRPRGRTSARAVRVLGARGLADPDRACSRCCAGGWRGPTSSPGRRWRGSRREQPELVDVGAGRRCASAGRSAPRELGSAAARERRAGEMWNWNAGKKALEYLFFAGQVTRRAAGQLRAPLRPARAGPPRPRSWRRRRRPRTRRSASCCCSPRGGSGVATEPDLGDYFRLPRTESKARLAELVEAGALRPSRCEGWDVPAYVAARPQGAAADPGAGALLTPFDSLVWARERTERLFDFRYRIEIYVPAPKRRPRLLRPAVPARRPAGRPGRPEKRPRRRACCGCVGAFAEPGVDPAEVAPRARRRTAAGVGVAGARRREGRAQRGPVAPALRRRAVAGRCERRRLHLRRLRPRGAAARARRGDLRQDPRASS